MRGDNTLRERFSGFLQKLGKFKFPILILLLGLLLLLLPGKSSPKAAEPETESNVDVQTSLTIQENALAELLSQIRGAGSVQVMLSLKSGEQVLYQSDTQLQTNSGDTEESVRQEDSTVLLSKGSGNQSALVRQVVAPVYQGALVVCQGADDPVVKLALVQAVSSVTGLGTDQITVVKMK